MSDLPFIDAHEIEVQAPPDAVWEATAEVVSNLGGPVGSGIAQLLGCAQTESDFPRTVVGFRVSSARPPDLIDLHGAHRFSRYSLEFRIRAGPQGATVLRAETRAVFPGLRGRLYRALVIGTRGHVVAVRRMLGLIRRRAERPGA